MNISTLPGCRRRAPIIAALLTLWACGGPPDTASGSPALRAPASAPAATRSARALLDSADSPDSLAPFAALTADSATILDDLRTLSADDMEGRLTGTEGAAKARAWLEARLREAGMAPLGDGYEHPFTWSTPRHTAQRTGVNLLASVPGTEPGSRVIVASAHYDHLGIRNGQIYNGADDNASGAVGLLAMARALRGHPLRHTVIWAEFDAEEEGMRGSRAFVADPPVPLARIALDLNLDMVSRTAGLLWAGGAHETPALRPILEKVAERSPVELRLGHDRPGAPEGDDWTNQSDQGPFNAVGIPFVYLGVEDHPDYHRPTDDFDRIDPGEYMNALRASLMVLLALDEALPLPVEGS
ncbi:MAG: M28 family peptidase [Gemmatimonadetes bacterium]|nr:M28 family peptidase [Gemmatimonadota bacterium]